MNRPENDFAKIHGTISPLGSNSKPQGADAEKRIKGAEAIAQALGIAKQTLSNGISAGSFDWLAHDGRVRVTLAGSAWNWQWRINPKIHEAAAQVRGQAGASASARDAEGRFTAVSAPGMEEGLPTPRK